MLTLMDWGIKFGQPPANIILDVSFFKNPWRDESIRYEKDKVLRRQMILKFMQDQKGVEEFIEKTTELLFTYYWLFPGENIVVAIFCSAGEYRSPAIVELLKKRFEQRYEVQDLIIKHGEKSKI